MFDDNTFKIVCSLCKNVSKFYKYDIEESGTFIVKRLNGKLVIEKKYCVYCRYCAEIFNLP